MDISVIVPTYKPQNYLWQCLDSLFHQTLNYNKYEIIIILNGCNEPYYGQIRRHIDSYKDKCQVMLQQTDIAGVSNARNLALDIANGKFICFVDDDDWVSENYLEALLNISKSENCLTEANVRNYNENTQLYEDDYLTRAYLAASKHLGPLTLLSARHFLSSSCCKLFPKAYVENIRFNPNLKNGEDALFMAQLSKNITGIRISAPNAVYFRRLRGESASHTKLTPWYHLKNTFYLYLLYGGTYLSAPAKYSATFFINRLLAVTKRGLYMILWH
jgi:glycosyltransferase involved in cell wall biosynthesis